MRSLTLIALAIIAFSAEAQQVGGGGEPPYPFARQACTGYETWTGRGSYAKLSRAQGFLPGTRNQLLKGLLDSVYLKMNAKTEVERAYGGYMAGRIFYKLKFVHFAKDEFEQVLARPTDSTNPGVQIAAADCVNRIRATYSGMRISAASYDKMKSLVRSAYLAEHKKALYLAMNQYLRTKESSYMMSEAANFGSSTYGALTKYLAHLKAGQELEATKYLSSLPAEYASFGHHTTGRALYGAGKYANAIVAFQQVKNTSNEFAESLTDKAWAYLILEKYADSIGAASNLFHGPLRKTFNPEVYGIVAMGLNETCNFREALETARSFRKVYNPVYRWLHTWNSQKRPPLYGKVASYLKKKGGIPDRIALEWLKSPIFIANQEELNALYDAKDLSRSGWAVVKGIRGADARYQGARAYLAGKFSAFLKVAPARESQLLAEMNRELQDRSVRMLVSLNEVADNIQKAETEVYSSLSDKVIADHLGVQQLGKNIERRKIGTAWDWGRAPAEESDEEEFWEDELGFLRADLKERCSTK